MITVLTRYEMLEGKEIDALEAIRKMAAAVKANEPGCLVYSVSRGLVDASELYFFEIYKDEKAFEDHGRSDHMRELQVTLDECIDNATFNVESLHQIAGFTREPLENMGG